MRFHQRSGCRGGWFARCAGCPSGCQSLRSLPLRPVLPPHRRNYRRRLGHASVVSFLEVATEMRSPVAMGALDLNSVNYSVTKITFLFPKLPFCLPRWMGKKMSKPSFVKSLIQLSLFYYYILRNYNLLSTSLA